MTSQSALPFLVVFFLWGCARQTTPNGGPQDKTPPKLLASTPANNQKNFKGRTITLTFSEDVKLKDPREQIIISPSAGKDVTFTAKQEQIIIQAKNNLRDSTTYSISFREGIQDITESNPAEDLRLAFSTGPSIDSLTFAGFISDALSEKIPQNITVAIFQSDTFDITRHIPEYFTKTNKQGRFSIRNLKAGLYKIYAFDDKNKNLKLETRTESFGFLPGKIDPSQITDSLQITMIHVDARKPRVTLLRHYEKYTTVKLNKALVAYSIRTENKKLLTAFGTDQTEFKVYYPQPFPDSLAATIHGTDSLLQSLDTVVYLRTGKPSLVKDPFKADLQDIYINLETTRLQTQILFNKPIVTINLDSVYFRLDSATTIPIVPNDLLYDSIHHRLEISKTLDQAMLATNTVPIKMHFNKYSFISIEEDSSKLIEKPFNVPKRDETATLLLEVQTTQPDFVIQLLLSDGRIIRSVRNQKKITLHNLEPTDYKIRILLDKNNNNKWDSGNINKDIPPERTLFYRNADKQYQFPIRANWEVGPYTISF